LNNPTHDYGAPDSLWELYNYTTFAMKEVHPGLWMENHISAHKFFTDYATDRQPAAVSVTSVVEEVMFNQLSIF
jgi:hypothetical protein